MCVCYFFCPNMFWNLLCRCRWLVDHPATRSLHRYTNCWIDRYRYRIWNNTSNLDWWRFLGDVILHQLAELNIHNRLLLLLLVTLRFSSDSAWYLISTGLFVGFFICSSSPKFSDFDWWFLLFLRHLDMLIDLFFPFRIRWGHMGFCVGLLG